MFSNNAPDTASKVIRFPKGSAEAFPPNDIAVVEEVVDRLLTFGPDLAQGLLFRLRRSFPGAGFAAVDPVDVECLVMSVMGMVASELRHPHRILPCLTALAGKYLGRRFTAPQLRTIRNALTSCIRQCLREDFEPAAEGAWARTTELLIAKMTIGEDQEERSAPRMRLVP